MGVDRRSVNGVQVYWYWAAHHWNTASTLSSPSAARAQANTSWERTCVRDPPPAATPPQGGRITWQPEWGNYVTDHPVIVAELRDRRQDRIRNSVGVRRRIQIP